MVHSIFIAFLFAATATLAGVQQTSPSSPSLPPPSFSSSSAPSFVIEEMTSQHYLRENGSGTKRVRVKVKVADPAAVSRWGTLTFPYLVSIEEVSLQQLLVEKPDGRQVKAASLALEEVAPPAEMDVTILSDLRAKRIAVPALEPGDRLFYEVLFTQSSSLIPGHFWFDHHFTRDVVVIHESLEVDAPSSRPLNVRVRRGSEAPGGSAAPGRIQRRWTHQQMVPEAPPATPEALEKFKKEFAQGPDVRVSSFQNWQQLGAWFAAAVDAKAEPDDTIRARARELTRGLATPEQRLNALYTFVSTQIRYISLAWGVGRLEPRSAGQVLATQYGDCKDKHVLLASLARAIDLEIAPVLISEMFTLDEQIPTPSQFNHVISVRTAAETSAWRWMDSTSGALPFGVLFEPLREKRALLVPVKPRSTASIVTTPAHESANAVAIEITGSITSDRLDAHVVRRYTGDLEYTMRLLGQNVTQAALADIGKEQVKEDNFGDPTEVTNTVVKDDGPGKGVVLSYDASRSFSMTYDKPWQIWLPAPRMQPSPLPAETETEVEIGLVDVALTVKYDVPAGLRVRPPVPVTLDRPFAIYTSSYRVDGQTLVQQRRLQTRVKKVTADQMDGYRVFVRAVDADFRQMFSADAIPRTEATPETADELHRAGWEALDKQRTKEAIDLLKRATARDPKHKRAWVTLGRAYHKHGDYAAAIEAIERQIALNPYDEYAHSHLANSLRKLKRDEEAIVHLKKHIEIVPLDNWAHGELGEIYVESKRWDDAVASLEKAVGISPENASKWFLLGRARLARNEADEAAAAFARAVELRKTPAMWNDVAWTLAEKGVKLEVATEYVRKAIDATASTLNDVTLDPLVPAQVKAAELQASYWDTLGWIYFQSGDLANAERWVRAAWMLSQHPEIGEHLAQIYEKQGVRARAIALYAQAASVGGDVAKSAQESSRKAFERLVGDGRVSEIQTHLEAARTALVKDRTINLPRLVQGAATAKVMLLVAADGRVGGVRFIQGDERLRAPLATVKNMKAPALQPDDRTMTFVRGGVVGCTASGGCTLILMRPADVLPPPGTPSASAQ